VLKDVRIEVSTPSQRVTIDTAHGSVIGQRLDPRDAFAGHTSTRRGTICTPSTAADTPCGTTSRSRRSAHGVGEQGLLHGNAPAAHYLNSYRDVDGL